MNWPEYQSWSHAKQAKSIRTSWPIPRYGIEDKVVEDESGQAQSIKLYLLKQLESVQEQALTDTKKLIASLGGNNSSAQKSINSVGTQTDSLFQVHHRTVNQDHDSSHYASSSAGYDSSEMSGLFTPTSRQSTGIE